MADQQGAVAHNIGFVTLSGNTHINADVFKVGAYAGNNGELVFGKGGGRLQVRGSDGVGPASVFDLGVGYGSDIQLTRALLDLGAGESDIAAGAVRIGVLSKSAVSNAVAQAWFGAGQLQADSLLLGGNVPGATGAVGAEMAAQGTRLRIGTLILGDQQANSQLQSTLTLGKNAELRMGKLQPGAQAGTAMRRFYWNGGTIGNLAPDVDLLWQGIDASWRRTNRIFSRSMAARPLRGSMRDWARANRNSLSI